MVEPKSKERLLVLLTENGNKKKKAIMKTIKKCKWWIFYESNKS
jgi:hypothetical protein